MGSFHRMSLRARAAALVWQSPGHSENHNRTCRGRCPHRPVVKDRACSPPLKEYFGSGSSGGNFLVPARKLIRSRLKGRCRKAAPLSIPRPHRRKCRGMFRIAIGGLIGGAHNIRTGFRLGTMKASSPTSVTLVLGHLQPILKQARNIGASHWEAPMLLLLA